MKTASVWAAIFAGTGISPNSLVSEVGQGVRRGFESERFGESACSCGSDFQSRFKSTVVVSVALQVIICLPRNETTFAGIEKDRVFSTPVVGI